MLTLTWLLHRLCRTVYGALMNTVVPDRGSMERVGRIVSLNIYPLKSAAGVRVDQLECHDSRGPRSGLVSDRCLVLTDDQGGFLTARRYPEMVRIGVELLDAATVRLTSSRAGQLLVRLDQLQAALERDGGRSSRCCVRVWNDSVPAVDCGEEAARWATAAIDDHQSEVRLRLYDQIDGGRRDPRHPALPGMLATDGAAFADLTGYMLLNVHSLDDLNRRIQDEHQQSSCSADHFRGNIVVALDGPQPFAEDRWRMVAMGDSAVFENVKPCTRCVLTTVDPLLGEKRADGQPLKMLKSYRINQQPDLKPALGQSPMFGVNLGLRRPGNVQIGDSVYVSY